MRVMKMRIAIYKAGEISHRLIEKSTNTFCGGKIIVSEYDIIDGNLGNLSCQQCRDATKEHKLKHKDNEKCFCSPELHYKDPDNGNEVWVHNYIQ